MFIRVYPRIMNDQILVINSTKSLLAVMNGFRTSLSTKRKFDLRSKNPSRMTEDLLIKLGEIISKRVLNENEEIDEALNGTINFLIREDGYNEVVGYEKGGKLITGDVCGFRIKIKDVVKEEEFTIYTSEPFLFNEQVVSSIDLLISNNIIDIKAKELYNNYIEVDFNGKSRVIEEFASFFWLKEFEFLGIAQDNSFLYESPTWNSNKDTSLFFLHQRSGLFHFVHGVSREELSLMAFNKMNEISDAASKIDYSLGLYAGKAVNSLNSLSTLNSLIAIMPYESKLSLDEIDFESYKMKKLQERDQFTYDLVKDSLNACKNVMQQANLVQVKEITDKVRGPEKEKVFNSFFKNVTGSGRQITISNTVNYRPKVKAVISYKDDYLEAKDMVLLDANIQSAKTKIKTSLDQVELRIGQLERAFRRDYSTVLSSYNSLLEERSKAIVNMKVMNAASKTFLEQLDAILSLQVRTWWSNSLIGIVANYVTIAGGKAYIDSKLIKENQMLMDNNVEMRYEDCDYWCVLRSGNKEMPLYGDWLSGDRNEEDFKDVSNNHCITFPENVLDNLGIKFEKDAPKTATVQGYNSCGKFIKVVTPAYQVSRPKIAFNDMSGILGAIQKVLDSHKGLVALYEANSQTLKTIEGRLLEVSMSLGYVERKLFVKNSLSAYATGLRDNLKYYEHVEGEIKEASVIEGVLEHDSEEAIELPEALVDSLTSSLFLLDNYYPDVTEVVRRKADDIKDLILKPAVDGRDSDLIFKIADVEENDPGLNTECVKKMMFYKDYLDEEDLTDEEPLFFFYVDSEGRATGEAIIPSEQVDEYSWVIAYIEGTENVVKANSKIKNFSMDDLCFIHKGEKISIIRDKVKGKEQAKIRVFVANKMVELEVDLKIKEEDHSFYVRLIPKTMSTLSEGNRNRLLNGREINDAELARAIMVLEGVFGEEIKNKAQAENDMSAAELEQFMLENSKVELGDDYSYQDEVSIFLDMLFWSYSSDSNEQYAVVRSDTKLLLENGRSSAASFALMDLLSRKRSLL